MAVKTTLRRRGKARPEPPPARSAYATLLSAADRVRTSFETVCARFDITGQQYNVLRILRGAEPEGLPTLTIAERVIERTPGITRMVDRLDLRITGTLELDDLLGLHVVLEITRQTRQQVTEQRVLDKAVDQRLGHSIR